MTNGNPLNLEIFVASPGDVAKERRKAKAVIDEIKETIGDALGLNVKSFLWEYDLGPGAHPGGVQGLVNARSNLWRSDILVGIFWTRLGTPTPDGMTGTEHEVMFSFERWKVTQQKPYLMLYFSKQPIPQDHDSEQWEHLKRFKKSLPKEILAREFDNTQHFQAIFRKHLTQNILRLWQERDRPTGAAQLTTNPGLGLVATAPDLIRTNTEIVTEAEEIFFATGSRSRDDAYLQAIETRLKEVPRLIHDRVLMGPPFRSLLKDHLRRLLELRSPTDRSLGYKTINLGIFENPLRQAEVFITGNEKRVLIVLPSRKGLGDYNNALLIQDAAYVRDMQSFVRQMYSASRVIETPDDVAALTPVLR